MQQKTYTELYALITALAGVGAFTPDEQVNILNFVNRRLFEAYQTSQMWPRYLVVGEQRTIGSNQTIPYSEATLGDIAEFIRIHRKQPFLRNSAMEFNFYVDSVGAHIINLSTSDSTSAFVTYKKTCPLMTTASVDVPLEFFYFIAHAAYSDFLLMDGQNEKAKMEELYAKNYLMLELERVDVISNNNSINSKFSTYINQQSR
tara:strand:+ start:318 stop:926 length:609 start_codon:yes stop_codon:yes gene_type:complete